MQLGSKNNSISFKALSLPDIKRYGVFEPIIRRTKGELEELAKDVDINLQLGAAKDHDIIEIQMRKPNHYWNWRGAITSNELLRPFSISDKEFLKIIKDLKIKYLSGKKSSNSSGLIP